MGDEEYVVRLSPRIETTRLFKTSELLAKNSLMRFAYKYFVCG